MSCWCEVQVLNLSAVETGLPAVRDLCTGLGRELGQAVTVNAP
jgi:hypothetical protein